MLFIAIMIAAFIGFGVDTFYPEPDYPEYPTALDRPFPVEKDTDELTEEEKAQQNQEYEEFQQKQKEYETQIKLYNRNVSIIAISLAVTILVLSIVFASRLEIISDGMMLGGVFTLLYGIGRGFAADDSQFRFIIITVGLVVAMTLGYIRFIKPHQEKIDPAN
jgi:hypothetical protein